MESGPRKSLFEYQQVSPSTPSIVLAKHPPNIRRSVLSPSPMWPCLLSATRSQARLESEIENLSWKFERAETTDRADLENQMDIAEKLRITLLKDFFATCA